MSNSPLTLQTLPLCMCECVCASTCVRTHFSSVIKLPKLWTNCSQLQLLRDDVFFSPLSVLVFIPLFHSPFSLPLLDPPGPPPTLSSCPHIPRSPLFILHSHVESQFSIPSCSPSECLPAGKDSPVCLHMDRIHSLAGCPFLLF